MFGLQLKTTFDWDFQAEPEPMLEYHGVGGPLRVSDARSVDPLLLAWVEAALQAGHPANTLVRDCKGDEALRACQDWGVFST
ncbi:MAG: hypothetical protein WCD11_29675 [Solirubrobacteraceae bacterium]